MADYERIALVKPEVFVYRIPPLGSNRGYRAAEWKLDAPDWTGRLRLVALGQKLELRLEDKANGELFAKCPIDTFPGPAVEAVNDSSRYFVIRLVNDDGNAASIGIGFGDRGDSFDLNVALQDHFKYVTAEKKSEETEAAEASRPKLDLGFKEGQTITINLGSKKPERAARTCRRTLPAYPRLPRQPPLQPPPPSPVEPWRISCVMAPGGVSITASARLKKDFMKIMRDPVPFVLAAPLQANILEWHYVVTGPPDTPYAGGVYHGKLVFPGEFPFKPPSIYMLTPNGRFQTKTRLCLSISDFHPDTWNPGWTVSTILTGLLSFMLENSPTLGSIQTTERERKIFARRSLEFNLKDRIFCDLFPELAEQLREELAKERERLAGAGVSGGGAQEESAAAAPASGFDLTYNLLIFAGVVALAFAVRYVLLNASEGGDSDGGS